MNTIAESHEFVRIASSLFASDELDRLKSFLAAYPEAGDLIKGTGGLRKVRWSRQGMGKRGGARVIYYFYDENNPVFLITAYAKAAQDDLSPQEKALLTKALEGIKADFKTKGPKP